MSEIAFYNEACATCGVPKDIHRGPADPVSPPDSPLMHSMWGNLDRCRNFVRCVPPRAAYGELPIAFETDTTAKPDRLLRFFSYLHLPDHLQDVSRPFAELANTLVATLPAGPERTVALRKLLESKDCAVRAKLETLRL